MKTNKKSNLDIFVCSHNDFNQVVTSDTYTVINSNDIKDDVDLPLDDKFYSELYHFKYVHDNIQLKKYVGFCHYRRYFDFLDEIPDMNERFSKFDCIVSKPLIFKDTIYEHYNKTHNIEDLELVGKIIKKKFPSYYNAFETFTNGNIFVPYNMFIMRRGYFKKYIKFVFTILNEYLKIVGTDINKRIEENKDKYLKDFYPNNTIEYQYRIGGYIAERLTNVFLMKNFKKMKIYDVIITEEKI